MKRSFVPLIFAALLGGCATLEVVEKSDTTGPGYNVQLPLQWIRLQAGEDQLAITRDGFGLQRIVVKRQAADASFPRQKKNADEKLLPNELAELHIAELKLGGEQMATLTTVENAPAVVGGRPGFRIHIQFRTASGLLVEQIHYGVAQKGYYYTLFYSAPTLYYFKKYQPEFDKIVASFKLL